MDEMSDGEMAAADREDSATSRDLLSRDDERLKQQYQDWLEWREQGMGPRTEARQKQVVNVVVQQRSYRGWGCGCIGLLMLACILLVIITAVPSP